MNNYEIKLPVFEGPFDLLLFFIERDEIDIYDIPISKITQEFLEYLQQLEKLNIEVAGEFILVAATLMRIKAKMLLPRPTINEQGEEIDPRLELVSHLLAYKTFKLAAQEMAVFEQERITREQRGNVITEIQNLLTKADSEAELLELDLYKLLKVYTKVMNRFKESSQKPVHQIVPYPYTIEGQRNFLLQILSQKPQISFVELIKYSEKNRILMIFNFLAILDLLQLGAIQLIAQVGINDFVISNKER
jgi:segregation and condensation protein A